MKPLWNEKRIDEELRQIGWGPDGIIKETREILRKVIAEYEEYIEQILYANDCDKKESR